MDLTIIDIGTNSLKLLVVKKSKPVYEDIKLTRLGEGIYKNALVKKQAMRRTLRELKKFVRISTRYGVSNIVAVGTETLRKAKNADTFVRKCREEAGINLRVLSKDEEAKLAFLGAVTSDKHNDIVVVDIGGASTELSYMQKQKIKSRQIKIGALVLTEKFQDDFTGMQNYVDRIVRSLSALPIKHKKLIGVGGTATTLASLIKKLPVFKIDKAKVHISQIKQMFDKLTALSVRERIQKYHLEPRRADIIPAGAVILMKIMQVINKKYLFITNRGLRHGILSQKINKIEPQSNADI